MSFSAHTTGTVYQEVSIVTPSRPQALLEHSEGVSTSVDTLQTHTSLLLRARQADQKPVTRDSIYPKVVFIFLFLSHSVLSETPLSNYVT